MSNDVVKTPKGPAPAAPTPDATSRLKHGLMEEALGRMFGKETEKPIAPSNPRVLLALANHGRSPGWERAKTVQRQMFEAAAGTGLEMKFAFYAEDDDKGVRRCRITKRWIADPDTMASTMDRAECSCGCYVNIRSVMQQAVEENQDRPMRALIIVGDAFHDDQDSLAEAALAANQLRREGTRVFLIQQGDDPVTARKLQYLQRVSGTLNLHIRPHFGRHMKVADVAYADIDALHRKVSEVGGPYAANRTIAIVSKMFNLAIRWNMRSDNPARGIERNAEIKRKRYLSGDELTRLVEALATSTDKQPANIVRLLLLTGSRKGEVCGMRWSEVDLTKGIWTKLASITKQKADHVMPLSAPALLLLNEIRAGAPGPSEYVFPSDSESGHVVDIKGFWAKIRRTTGIVNLRPHDLRHNFASELASGGASLPMIGALLGHADPVSTARYAHLFQDPQRAATEKVGAVVIAAGKRNGG